VTTVGDAKRDEAMARVERNAAERWKTAAYAVGKVCARFRPSFTSEDVLIALEAEGFTTHENRALGPVMRHLVTDGMIAKYDPDQFEKCKRPSRNSGVTRRWRSLIYGG
jgi:hypothetical protein